MKVLDWGAPGPFKIFAAGLTNFGYEVTFRNVRSGTSAVFKKPAGAFAGYGAELPR